MFGMPGHLELLIVGCVMVLLFGHRLPSVARSVGEAVGVFRESLRG